MAKRELRKSLKSEIENLFKSPEQAEHEFQCATKRRRLTSSEKPTKSPSTSSDDPSKPKLELRLSRLGDGHRLDCEIFQLWLSLFTSAYLDHHSKSPDGSVYPIIEMSFRT